MIREEKLIVKSVNYLRMLMNKINERERESLNFDYIVIEAIKYCFGISTQHAKFFLFENRKKKIE